MIGIAGIARDITERMMMEAALRESEEKFRAVFESARDAIFMKDGKGRFTLVNSGMKRIFQLKVSEIIGLTAGDIFGPEHEERDERINARVMAGETVEMEETLPVKGSPKTFHSLLVPIRNGSSEVIGICGIARDITATRQLETKLRQAQKMEAIGTLAGGIAHDFNNILASIMGYTESALYRKLPGNSPARTDLEQVLKASFRAKDLISQILTFSRQGDQEKHPIHFVPIIKEAVRFLRATLPSTLKIHEFYDTPQCTILADQIQIYQVLMNLCSNAAHAMGNRGILEVSVTESELSPEKLDTRPDLKPGEYLRLTVSDTGRGIDPAIMNRIFDPFFTLKRPGEGTGLGLSVVYGIVQSHNGMITVDSIPGQGTIVHTFFPIHEKSSRNIKEQGRESVGGSETILFVDDEETLVNMQKEALEYLGYNVHGTTSSKEALGIFMSDPSRFDLVITDQTMPDMTGLQLAHKILLLRPDTPIIICTGFSTEINKEEVKQKGIMDFLYKPIPFQELTEKIRKVLDDSQSGNSKMIFTSKNNSSTIS